MAPPMSSLLTSRSAANAVVPPKSLLASKTPRFSTRYLPTWTKNSHRLSLAHCLQGENRPGRVCSAEFPYPLYLKCCSHHHGGKGITGLPITKSLFFRPYCSPGWRISYRTAVNSRSSWFLDAIRSAFRGSRYFSPSVYRRFMLPI